MNFEYKVGDEVVRTKGDYVVGRRGVITDTKDSRAQVAWYGETKTWVSFTAIALTSIPYKIIPSDPNKKRSYPKYQLIDGIKDKK